MLCPNCLYNVRPAEINNLQYGCPVCNGYSSKEYWESPKYSNFPNEPLMQNSAISCRYCASSMLPTAELTYKRSNGTLSCVWACHQHFSSEFYGENIDLTPFRTFNEDLWNCTAVYNEDTKQIIKEIGINEEIVIGEKVRYARGQISN